MTAPLQLDIRSDADIETLIRALQLRDQLKPEWKLRPATVTFAQNSAILVVLDGDSEPVRVFSLIGSVHINDRVMTLVVPGSGNFILGTIGLNPNPGQIIKFAERTSSSSTTTTTELPVLRLDNIRLTGGRSYLITSGQLFMDSDVASDSVLARYRYATGGASATTASTSFATAYGPVNNSAAAQAVYNLSRVYHPTADEIGSVLLSVVRGSGSGNVSLVYGTGFQIEINVIDLGPTPANTGISL